VEVVGGSPLEVEGWHPPVSHVINGDWCGFSCDLWVFHNYSIGVLLKRTRVRVVYWFVYSSFYELINICDVD